jgi:hypothetical protein
MGVVVVKSVVSAVLVKSVVECEWAVNVLQMWVESVVEWALNVLRIGVVQRKRGVAILWMRNLMTEIVVDMAEGVVGRESRVCAKVVPRRGLFCE